MVSIKQDSMSYEVAISCTYSKNDQFQASGQSWPCRRWSISCSLHQMSVTVNDKLVYIYTVWRVGSNNKTCCLQLRAVSEVVQTKQTNNKKPRNILVNSFFNLEAYSLKSSKTTMRVTMHFIHQKAAQIAHNSLNVTMRTKLWLISINFEIRDP